ncbi:MULTISPECIES: bacteriophage N4 adsorption protein A [Pseudomonas]|uniref:Bacteriophage N4 adsorption protein A n=3 Tax=Pseudomonas savastanoi TaxID=29438 RepID=A0A267KC81_PSESS|nr:MULTISPECIES: bacteriophage N4 adsorption protein A [Pseudomonas]ARD11172.1 peptidase aspartic, active site protein [Pseudomonas savastanoi pv. savastanoi NCPPB 3335]KAA3547728.1 bacteriophage N4 adsorption protein A [Pseudomonas savastanoi]KPB17450.1 Bacteriophage N4 adsorption protein A precursor [Pseudomonas savastanoi]KPY66847.1 Tetratricopeptide repeat-containing protein [Pseudomonas savastanoi pv. savastanoi]MBA4704018.1 tetratricopeptide repeat protein [Pseudomonas savastanoi pv. sav
MKRPFILSLLVSGLGLVAPLSQAETLPLPLTGPAYAIANEAYMAYNRKDYDLAIAKAREALRQRADADQLRDLIALAERDKYRRDHPQRFPKARPKPGYLEGNQALRAYANRDYDGSANHARKAIAQAPKNLDYRMMLIEALQRQQRLDEAQLAAIQEQAAVDKAASGYKALARGDNDTAVSEAREAVRSFPKQMAYRKLLVSALIAQGQYAEARSAATEALALNGNDATLLVQRGQMRQRLGDQDGARQDFAQALAVGNLPLREQASLYAAMGQPSKALQRLQKARDAGELQPGDEVQIAYFLSQAGDDRGALDEFKRVDRSSGLKPREVQDAAYSAMRTPDDAQAIAYFKRVLDYQKAGDLQMPAQQVFDTRRAVSDLSREWGLTNTTTYRGASTSSGSGLNSAPSSNTDSVQNSTEVFWRPLGYRNARFVELYGRVTDTLWSKDGDSDTGADALQGALGIRVKPFSSVNVIGAFERTFPLGNSNADGDWLVRLGYGSSIGTDLRVDVPSWWTSQLYAEGGRYLQDKRNYFNSEWQVGRSFRLDSISPRLVVFPHVVAAVDYDSKMRSEVDSLGRSSTSSGNAGGLGVGTGVRYWFREDTYKAPQSYVDFSVQYREKVFGDDRAQGVFARMTFSW